MPFCYTSQREKKLLFFLHFYLTCVGLSVAHATTLFKAIRFGNVTLQCDGSTMRGSSWYFRDELLFTNSYFVGSTHGDVQLSNNYSLFIQGVTFHHEGAYICRRNFSDVVTYNLLVEGNWLPVMWRLLKMVCFATIPPPNNIKQTDF